MVEYDGAYLGGVMYGLDEQTLAVPEKGWGRQKTCVQTCDVTLRRVEEESDCSVLCKKADVRLMKLEVRLL